MNLHFISYHWHRFLKWCRFMGRTLCGTAIHTGDYYIDCGWIPRRAIKATAFDIRGDSLVPSHGPGAWGDCDPEHCAPEKVTKEEAEWQALHGPRTYKDNRSLRRFHKDHNQKTWWKPVPEFIDEVLWHIETCFVKDQQPLLTVMYDGLFAIPSTDQETFDLLLAHGHWFKKHVWLGLAILIRTRPYQNQLKNYSQFFCDLTSTSEKSEVDALFYGLFPIKYE